MQEKKQLYVEKKSPNVDKKRPNVDKKREKKPTPQHHAQPKKP